MGGPSPYDIDYVERGLGAYQAGPTSRKDWRRIPVVALLIIGALWTVASRCEFKPWHKNYDTPHLIFGDEFQISSPTTNENYTSLNKLPSDVYRPTSLASDPDPARTARCDEPYSHSLPLLQYAIVIDAGSTGSRIHIYKFNNCKRAPDFEYDYALKTSPGLSSYAGSPVDAAKSLDVLLKEAHRIIPEALWKRTPVTVKATAGLRLLPVSQRDDIMRAVEGRLREAYPFLVPDHGAAVTMEGKDEGVYAWITANYLLHTIRADTPDDTQSYAALEMGGASTQIVFEPTNGQVDGDDYKYDLHFAGKEHTLYQHSYLGYGSVQARKRVHELVNFMTSHRHNVSRKEVADEFMGNPCLAKGTKTVVEIDDPVTKRKRNVTMGGDEIGSFEACNKVVQLTLAKDVICDKKPCAFDGVYQPSLPTAFPSEKVLLFSAFYYDIDPLAVKTPGSLVTKVRVGDIAVMAERVCGGREEWVKHWNSDIVDQLQARPEWCLNLTFIYALLKTGYGFGDQREMTIGRNIEGTELGWSLGAALMMIGEIKT